MIFLNRTIKMPEKTNRFEVVYKKKIAKKVALLPLNIREKFIDLVSDLERKGPVQMERPNYSKLGKNEYHCHLTRSWVACWTHEKNQIRIEITYAGSRESAPY